MEVNFDNWTHTRMSVTPNGYTNPIYNVECKYLKQKLIFTSTATGEPVATSKLHLYKNSFEIDLNGSHIQVNSDKFWTIQRSYNSAAFGQTITWKSGSSWSKIDFVCLDAGSLPIAKFTASNGWSNRWKKVGKLEIDDGHNLSDAQRDEVVVVGLTLAYQIVQGMNASSNAASSAASAAAGAAAV